jgi:hypothetical protein
MCLILLGALPLLAQQSSEAGRRPPTAAQVMKFFEVMHIHDQMQSMLQTEAMRVSYSRLQPEIEKMMKNMNENIKQMAEQPDGASDSKTSVAPSPEHH